MAGLQHLTPFLVLRVVCGLFFVPHIVGKFTAREASFNFFRAAGFRPAPPFAYLAMGIEIVLAVMLILGLYVNIVGWIACGYLLIASVAVIKVNRKWLWHIGGCEYPVFWAISCAIVAAAAR
ncbi:MAG: DoxX family protein [Steroidobacteraceae bacterium]